MLREERASFSSIFSPSMTTKMVTHQEVADRLLADKMLLTALEFHTELQESGRELPSLTQFFSEPTNLMVGDQLTDSPGVNMGRGRSGNKDISRSASQMTLDSIDQMTRYSEETDRRDEDRVAVLEYELRTARETISQLRTELTELTAIERRGERLTSDVQEDEREGERETTPEEIPMKPYERKCLNFLVNDYLVREGFKFTAITFSDECDGQDFDDWEEVGLVSSRPPSLLHMFRGDENQVGKTREEGSQTEKAEEETNKLKESNDILHQKVDEFVNIIEVKDKDKTALEEELKTALEDLDRHRQEFCDLQLEKSQLEEKLKSSQAIVESEHVTRDEDVEREDGDGASIADDIHHPVSQEISPSCPTSLEQVVQQSLLMSSRPVSDQFQLRLHQIVFPLSLESGMLPDDNDIVCLLANSLPSLVSSLVLSARSEVIPLMLYTISKHQDTRVRDQLVGILFNLMKRPDNQTRTRILSGVMWLIHQSGWSSARIESEVLPQCWEQVNHKHPERRILVGQAVALLAPRLDQSIRSSLLVSMLCQLLEDRDPMVSIVGVRSLAVVVNILEDEDKMDQILQVSLGLLKRSDLDQQVRTEIVSCLLPLLGVWLTKLGRYEESVFNILISDMEGLPNDTEETVTLVKLRLLTSQLPLLVFSILSNLPSSDKANPSELESLSSKGLEDIELHPELVIMMGETTLEQALTDLTFLTQGDNKVTRTITCLVTKLIDLMVRTSHQQILLIEGWSKFLVELLLVLGNKISKEKIVPLIEGRIGPNNGVLAILVSALARGQSDIQSQSMSMLTRWLTYFVETGGPPCPSLTPVVELMSSGPIVTLLVDTLRECVASPVPGVRGEVGRLLNLLVSENLPEDVVSRRLVPAMVSLASDPEHNVVKAAIPGLSSLLVLPCLPWEEKERVSVQMSSLLCDSEDQAVVLEVLHHLPSLVTSCDQDVRDHLILTHLTTLPDTWKRRGFTNIPDLSSALLAVYSTIPDLGPTESILSGYVLPGLANLLEEVQGEEQLESEVLLIMSEVEGSRRRVDRRGSTSSALSSDSPASSKANNMKEKVNKLFTKQPGTGVPFWKK